jgi:hypothetical protein
MRHITKLDSPGPCGPQNNQPVPGADDYGSPRYRDAVPARCRSPNDRSCQQHVGMIAGAVAVKPDLDRSGLIARVKVQPDPVRGAARGGGELKSLSPPGRVPVDRQFDLLVAEDKRSRTRCR